MTGYAHPARDIIEVIIPVPTGADRAAIEKADRAAYSAADDIADPDGVEDALVEYTVPGIVAGVENRVYLYRIRSRGTGFARA